MNFAPTIKRLILSADLNEVDICEILDQQDSKEIPYITMLKKREDYNWSLGFSEYKKQIELLENKVLLEELKKNAIEEALNEFFLIKSRKPEIGIKDLRHFFYMQYSNQIANVVRASIPTQEYLANLSKDQMISIGLRNRQEHISIIENRHIWDSILAKEFLKMSKDNPICSNLILQKWGEKKEYDRIKKDIEGSSILSDLFQFINISIINLRQKFSRCQKDLLQNVVKSYKERIQI